MARGLSAPRALVWITIIASAAALIVVWVIQPGAPPIYDGLPLGSPPYRFLVPHPNFATTPAPTTARKTFQIAGTPYGFELATGEPDPQASVLIPLASLELPPHAAVLTVTIEPVVPPQPPPLGTIIDGNDYRFTVTTAGHPVALRPGRTVRVTLRHTGSPGRPTVALLRGTSWKELSSVEEAVGSSTADSPALGDLALLISTRSSGGISGPLVAALIVAGVLAAMAVALVVIARRRRE